MSAHPRPAATSSAVTSGSGLPTSARIASSAAPTACLAIGTLLAVSLAPLGAALAGEALGFRTSASAAQEVQDPPVESDGRAQGTFSFKRSLTEVGARVSVQRLVGAVAAAHLHCARAGANGPIVVNLNPIPGGTGGLIIDGAFTNDDVSAGCTAECGFEVNNIASLRFAAEQGCLYLNVHTANFPGGEVRGQLLER